MFKSRKIESKKSSHAPEPKHKAPEVAPKPKAKAQEPAVEVVLDKVEAPKIEAKPAVAAAPVAPVTRATFPERKAEFPDAPKHDARIWVNGNPKSAADGVKREMTAVEVAALDGIDPIRFVRLDYHRGNGTQSIERPTDAIRVEDGMYFTVQRR